MHSYHALTHVCVSVVVCVVHKPRPCLSYSRRRDRINLVLLHSHFKGGGRVHSPTRVTFRRVAVSLRGPGQSPILPFACCVGWPPLLLPRSPAQALSRPPIPSCSPCNYHSQTSLNRLVPLTRPISAVTPLPPPLPHHCAPSAPTAAGHRRLPANRRELAASLKGTRKPGGRSSWEASLPTNPRAPGTPPRPLPRRHPRAAREPVPRPPAKDPGLRLERHDPRVVRHAGDRVLQRLLPLGGHGRQHARRLVGLRLGRGPRPVLRGRALAADDAAQVHRPGRRPAVPHPGGRPGAVLLRCLRDATRPLFRGGSWWFVVVRGDSWWFVVVRGGSWWFVVVRGGSWWFGALPLPFATLPRCISLPLRDTSVYIGCGGRGDDCVGNFRV